MTGSLLFLQEKTHCFMIFSIINMCAECYQAAGEESRYKILQLLRDGSQNVGQLTRALHLSQPTTTHHLKLLERVGLVRMEQMGKEHRFSLNTSSECFKDCGLLQGLV